MNSPLLPKRQQYNVNATAVGLKTATILLATLILFYQDWVIIFNDALKSEFMSHVLAIPFIFAYLVYRKRKMLKAVIPLENKNQPKEIRHLPTIAGILLSTIAMLLYWYGSYTFTPLEYHMFALPIFVAGLSLIIFNPQTLRQLVFPVAFLLFLMPPPSEILFAWGATLSVVSSEASNAIVNLAGIPSTITAEYGNPTIMITRPNGTIVPFTVDIACSGIYSLVGFFIFVVVIAYVTRDKAWKKLVLVVLGLPLIYLLNIIRITIILLIGYHYGEQLALQVFHLLGGWILVFLGTLLLLVISEKVFKAQIFTNPTEKCQQCNPKMQSIQSFCFTCGRILELREIKIHKSDIAKIFAVVASVFLLLSVQAPIFALTQGPAVVIINTPSGQQVSTEILPKVQGYDLQFAYRDPYFEEIAKQDMSLVYLYAPKDESRKLVWVALEIASTRAVLHRWETCLITWPISQGYQPKAIQIEQKDIEIAENPPIISRFFVFQSTETNLTEAVLYWYESTAFTVNSTSQQEHVKISLIAYPKNPEELPKIENQLVALAKPIANYWQPIKTWSLITMHISQSGAELIVGTSILLAVATSFYALGTGRQRKSNKRVYEKLSKLNRQIVDAVQETERKGAPTLDNIADTYREKIGETTDKEQLLQKLRELEGIGIVKSHVANRQDEPIQIWKTQI